VFRCLGHDVWQRAGRGLGHQLLRSKQSEHST
jgi:hypothetical protein